MPLKNGVGLFDKGENRMKYTYKTRNTCSRSIEFEIEDGIVKNVKFNVTKDLVK